MPWRSRWRCQRAPCEWSTIMSGDKKAHPSAYISSSFTISSWATVEFSGTGRDERGDLRDEADGDRPGDNDEDTVEDDDDEDDTVEGADEGTAENDDDDTVEGGDDDDTVEDGNDDDTVEGGNDEDTVEDDGGCSDDTVATPVPPVSVAAPADSNADDDKDNDDDPGVDGMDGKGA
eukprot:TRINITY_DN11813_c0_g2_i1.p2 TRINITY_DN11813_c0_g2~~TRINITY_DN11813_c0_g2_i1.p2  ORF type:complete len:176 (-),score=45.93 TRINITY_DN11813_c0_g2_i1:300-827(-)